VRTLCDPPHGVLRIGPSATSALHTRIRGNNGNTQMTITSNGNLGLGTCNPTAKLDIRG
jgi:hypothetical protein